MDRPFESRVLLKIPSEIYSVTLPVWEQKGKLKLIGSPMQMVFVVRYLKIASPRQRVSVSSGGQRD